MARTTPLLPIDILQDVFCMSFDVLMPYKLIMRCDWVCVRVCVCVCMCVCHATCVIFGYAYNSRWRYDICISRYDMKILWLKNVFLNIGMSDSDGIFQILFRWLCLLELHHTMSFYLILSSSIPHYQDTCSTFSAIFHYLELSDNHHNTVSDYLIFGTLV